MNKSTFFSIFKGLQGLRNWLRPYSASLRTSALCSLSVETFHTQCWKIAKHTLNILWCPHAAIVLWYCWPSFNTMHERVNQKSKANRSSHQRCSIRKTVLKNFTAFTGKNLCWSLFLIKRPRTEKETTQVFSCEYCKVLRTAFL